MGLAIVVTKHEREYGKNQGNFAYEIAVSLCALWQQTCEIYLTVALGIENNNGSSTQATVKHKQ